MASASSSDPLTAAAVSAICWIPRGSAAARPRSYLLEAQERQTLKNYFQQQEDAGRRVAAGRLKNAQKKKETKNEKRRRDNRENHQAEEEEEEEDIRRNATVGSRKATVTAGSKRATGITATTGTAGRRSPARNGRTAAGITSSGMEVEKEDEEDWEEEASSETESMDAAEEDDEDDESQTLFGVVKEDGPATLNDPYLDLEEAEDSEEEEANHVLPTDLLLVAANAEADLSSLEVYVYDEDSSSFYVHHDVLTGGYPLCLEWIDTCPTAGREGAPKKNLVASGSFDPEISLWDLDVLDRIDAVCTLGGEPQLIAGQPGAKASKQKKKKQQRAAGAPSSSSDQQGHEGPVMTLHKSPMKGHILASGSADESVKLWDLITGTCVHTYSHHKDKVQAIRWHPTEQAALLTTGYDRTAALLDVREPQNIVYAPTLSADAESCVWDRHHPFSFWVRHPIVISSPLSIPTTELSDGCWLVAAGNAEHLLVGTTAAKLMLLPVVRLNASQQAKHIVEIMLVVYRCNDVDAIVSQVSTEDGCVTCYDVRRMKSSSSDTSGMSQGRKSHSSVLWRIQAHEQAASGVTDSKIFNLMVTCGVDGNAKIWKVGSEDTDLAEPSGRNCAAGKNEGDASVEALSHSKQLSTNTSNAPSLVFERELKAGPLYCCSSNEDVPQVLGFGGKCVVVWDITDTELVKNAFQLK